MEERTTNRTYGVPDWTYRILKKKKRERKMEIIFTAHRDKEFKQRSVPGSGKPLGVGSN